MISILIPIYNFDVRDFVRDLSEQLSQSGIPGEIICLDDKSNAGFKALNAELGELDYVAYFESDINLGRSAVRNALKKKARFEHLLILDCDGKVNSPDYIADYLKETADYDIIYGGRTYTEKRPYEAGLHFHWYVGKNREEVDAHVRSELPYGSFMTNNFLIRSDVYDDVLMDETVEGYGHEDTLFAEDAKAKGYRIKHINNPIEHIGLEEVDVFLDKSRNAVRNLARLYTNGQVGDTVKMIRVYKQLSRYQLMWLITAFVYVFETRMLNSLRGAAPNLVWFDLWKLSLLHAYLREH